MKRSRKDSRHDAEPLTNKKEHNTDTGICINVSNQYEKIGRIGQGTYGIVYKARHCHSHQLVALKKCVPHHVTTDGFPLTTLRELNILRMMRHEHIVSLLNVAVSSSSVFLVLEFCEHELGQLVDAHYDRHEKSPFSHAATKTLTKQLLSALSYLHSHHCIHRDVKLSNLLYHDGRLKLADFGLARGFASDLNLTPNVASLWYRAPELLFTSSAASRDSNGCDDDSHDGDKGSSTASVIQYDQSMDIWAAACVYCELMLGTPPMNGRTEMEQIRKVVEFCGPPPSEFLQHYRCVNWDPQWKAMSSSSSPQSMLHRFSGLSISGLRFLTGMLEYEPAKRWTARRALDCEYLTVEEPLPLLIAQMPRFGTTRASIER